MSRAHRTAGACMTTRSSRSFCSALRSIRLSTNADERCIKDAAFCSAQKLHAMLSHDGCGSKEKKGGRCGIATTPGVAPSRTLFHGADSLFSMEAEQLTLFRPMQWSGCACMSLYKASRSGII